MNNTRIILIMELGVQAATNQIHAKANTNIATF